MECDGGGSEDLLVAVDKLTEIPYHLKGVPLSVYQ